MNHGTTGKIDCPFLKKKACGSPCFQGGIRIRVGVRTGPVPYHMGNGQVGEGEPQGNKGQNCGKFHTLGESAEDQGRSDGREGGLKKDIDQFGDNDTLRESGSH